MTLISAVSSRIIELCNERNITINKLSTICGITQSTLEGIVNMKFINPKTLTIVRICRGLEIKLKDFYNSPLFDEIDDERQLEQSSIDKILFDYFGETKPKYKEAERLKQYIEEKIRFIENYS